jgi:hypothetical protein
VVLLLLTRKSSALLLKKPCRQSSKLLSVLSVSVLKSRHVPMQQRLLRGLKPLPLRTSFARPQRRGVPKPACDDRRH